LSDSRCDARNCTHVLSGIIGHPANEGDLVALSTVLVKLDIVHSVAAAETLDTSLVLALGADQLLAESLVVVLGGRLLNNDLLVVVGDLEDDPLGALAELEVVECSDALGSDGDTGEWVSVAAGSFVIRLQG
jgi:hypothetical protein